MHLGERLGPLEEKPFRLLWLGQTASATGDALIPVALAFAVLTDLDGSAAQLGLVLASFTVMRVAFILVGGVWADRLPRRRVMLACDLVRGAVDALTAVLLLTGAAEVWMLILTAGLFGAASAFFVPASSGLIPDTISPGRLQQANALIGVSRNGTEIFGPALSGLVIATAGTGWVFAIDSASFAFSAAFLLALHLRTESRPAQRQTFLRDLARGWYEVRSRLWLWTSFIAFALSNLAIAVFVVLGPLVMRDELGGARDWGLALTISAIGAALGSAAALKLRPRRPLIPGFLALGCLGLMNVSLVPPFPAVVVGVAAGLGFGGVALFNALWETVLQQNVPREALSRVSSYDWLVSLVIMPVGFALAGPAANAIGLDATLLIAAAIGVGVNLAVLAIPDVRAVRATPSLPPVSVAEGESDAPEPLARLP
jgi:MFS family permease